MSTLHPPIERLAELIDGSATPFEREHVAACASCTRELDAYGRLVALASDERRRIGPPITSWDLVRAGLASEGLLSTAGGRRVSPVRRWVPRVAAAAMLLASGTAVGRKSAGLSWVDAVAPRSLATVANTPLSDGAGSAMLASNTSGIQSSQQALDQLERAQRAYEEAAAYLAAHDTSSSSGASDQYRTRLAALDMASETFEQALTDAPEDPIINQYYRATMNAREVAIRRLGTTLPVSLRMGRF
jgi:hypothetical protein